MGFEKNLKKYYRLKIFPLLPSKRQMPIFNSEMITGKAHALW